MNMQPPLLNLRSSCDHLRDHVICWTKSQQNDKTITDNGCDDQWPGASRGGRGGKRGNLPPKGAPKNKDLTKIERCQVK